MYKNLVKRIILIKEKLFVYFRVSLRISENKA